MSEIGPIDWIQLMKKPSYESFQNDKNNVGGMMGGGDGADVPLQSKQEEEM